MICIMYIPRWGELAGTAGWRVCPAEAGNISPAGRLAHLLLTLAKYPQGYPRPLHVPWLGRHRRSRPLVDMIVHPDYPALSLARSTPCPWRNVRGVLESAEVSPGLVWFYPGGTHLGRVIEPACGSVSPQPERTASGEPHRGQGSANAKPQATGEPFGKSRVPLVCPDSVRNAIACGFAFAPRPVRFDCALSVETAQRGHAKASEARRVNPPGLARGPCRCGVISCP